MATKKLVLIDAYNQIHRAYHALPELTNSAGQPTNAVYGFTTMLRKLLEDEKPDHCAVVFDTAGPTVRHIEYEGYKASRPSMPDDLSSQIPWIRRVVEAHRIPILEMPKYEADDVIGTLARLAEAAGVATIIASEDKDLLQLVTDKVHLRTDRAEKHLYDPAEVMRKYGVPPERIADLLGLMGDSVDEIPGVPGIGPKRARELLETYDTLENAVEHAGDLAKYKYGRNLAEFADQAHLSKRLATLYTNLELDRDLESMRLQEPDRAACREIFTELEFTRLLDDYEDAPKEAEGEYRTIAGPEAMAAAMAAARAAGRVAIAVQTDSFDANRARLIGVGLAWSEGNAVYVPVGHQGLGTDNAVRPEECLGALAALFDDPAVQLTGHDLKPALIMLARAGFEEVNPWLDVMLGSYVVHPTRQSHALPGLALDFLNIKAIELKDVLPDRKASFDSVPVAEATRYAGERADIALRLAAALEPQLRAQPDLGELLASIEMPLMRVLARMERRGVRIDASYLSELSTGFARQIDALQETIFEAAGGPFNLNSPKQLAEVLFDKLQLSPGGRTAKGSRSTKAEVLEKLAEEFPVARKIIEYRELSKLKSTYLDALPTYVNPATGRVHASFDQAVAATGRLSSSNPNLQNIPVRTATGRQIRGAFIPADGCVLMTADYSQIELRIMAHLSGDPAMKTAFAEGVDVHRTTASEIFHVAPDAVTSEQRDRAKVINFGVLYGMGPQRIAREFGVSNKEAREFIDRYLSAFPKVQEYLSSIVERAKQEGYVTTLLGRIRHLPELQSGRPMIRAFGERAAVNTPLQGTAADLIKLAMVNLDRRLQAEAMGTGMIIQVHDELVLEVPESEVDRATQIVREEMHGAIQLEVPLLVDVGVGGSWMVAKG